MLLFENLDLNQQYVRYPADRKTVVENIVGELKGKPLSTGILTHCAIEKTKDGKDYKLVCRKKQTQTALNTEIRTPKQNISKENGKLQLEIDETITSKIKFYKASLTNDERAELRQKSLNKIRNNKDIKEDFISEPLIESFENELIKEKLK